MKNINNMPGHLIRRFHQISVAVFHAEVCDAGFDLTPVQFAALASIKDNPGIDQATLAGLIAYDRTTITGVVDRLVHKGLITRQVSDADRRARMLHVTDDGRDVLRKVTPAVEAVQEIMMCGLNDDEAEELMRLMHKATVAVNDLSRAPQRDAESNK